MLKPPELTETKNTYKVRELINDETSAVSSCGIKDDGTWWCYISIDSAVKASQATADRGRHSRNILMRATKKCLAHHN